jgi:hypothetical protein
MIDSMSIEERKKSHKDLKILFCFHLFSFCGSAFVVLNVLITGDLSKTIYFVALVIFLTSLYASTKDLIETYHDIVNDFYKVNDRGQLWQIEEN